MAEELCNYCFEKADFVLDDDSFICEECWNELNEAEKQHHGGICCELTKQ